MVTEALLLDAACAYPHDALLWPRLAWSCITALFLCIVKSWHAATCSVAAAARGRGLFRLRLHLCKCLDCSD